MLKTWHIMLFSLIPLALVFAGVVAGSFYGVGAAREPTPTPAPATATSAAPSPGAAPSDGGPATTLLEITAKDLKFDKRALAAPANTEVTVRMTNNDAGVLHNIAFYTNRNATQKIYTGETFAGVKTIEEKFRTPGAGTYFFRCDVHPDMNGSFTVR